MSAVHAVMSSERKDEWAYVEDANRGRDRLRTPKRA